MPKVRIKAKIYKNRHRTYRPWSYEVSAYVGDDDEPIFIDAGDMHDQEQAMYEAEWTMLNREYFHNANYVHGQEPPASYWVDHDSLYAV